MKRTKVKVQRKGYDGMFDKAFQMGTFTVEARCEKCELYEQLLTGGEQQTKGKCHLKPRKVLKDEHDWCSKFKPDEGKL